MRAAQMSVYGGPEVLQITSEAAKPVPAAGQVLVAVAAASVNPFDVAVREGLARQMAELKFPATLGGDFAGTVAALGEGVTDYQIGQAVYGQAGSLSGNGSFAEFAPAKVTSLASKPESVDFISAAGLPLVASSALQAMEFIQLLPNQRILIHGGAGGIGSMAIQLAKSSGAYVITTATSADAAFLKELGADEVIDYESQDFSQLLTDIDAVLDTVGGDTNSKSYLVVKDGGAFVSMVQAPVEDEVASKQLRYDHQFTRTTHDRLSEIAKLVDAGNLTVKIDKVFQLEAASEALNYLKTGHPKGKVVIQIA